MKKVSLVLLIALLPLFGQAQSVFDRFESMDQVSSVVINKGMINLIGTLAKLDTMDDETKELVDLARGLREIKVFVTEDTQVSKDMKEAVGSYLTTKNLEELMRIKDSDGTNVKFFVKNGKKEDHVTELLMFVSGMEDLDLEINHRKLETVLVSLVGDLDLNKVGVLTRKMDLPQDLNKAEKSR